MMHIQINKTLCSKGLQSFLDKLCGVCYAFLLLLTSSTIHANTLNLVTPASKQASTQDEFKSFDSDGTEIIEFKKSIKKENNKEISTAKWSNQQGFEFTSKYQENMLNWRNITPSMHFSNTTWDSRIKLPINNVLSATGEFKIGKTTSRFSQSDYQLNNHLEPTYFNGTQDYHQVSHGLTNSHIKLGLSGKTSLINYGIDYSSIGSQYDTFDKKINKRDRAGFKYWVARSFKDLTIETSYSKEWNNVDADHDRSRVTDDLMGIKASYALTNWPYSSVSIGYQTGRQESSFEPENKQHYSGDIDIVSADFYVTGDGYSLSLGSSLETTSDDLNLSDKKIIYNYISASYYSSGVSIVPSLYTSNAYYSNSDYIYKSLGSSLSLSYTPKNKPYNLSFYVNHDRNKSNDQYTFNDSISAGASLDWQMKLPKKTEHIFTLKVENYNYIDHVYSETSSSDLFVGISSQLVGL